MTLVFKYKRIDRPEPFPSEAAPAIPVTLIGSKEKIDECVKLCNDNSKTEEEFYNSCSSILKYGGEKVFNDYMESCR